MNGKEKWVMDFSGYEERDRGLRGIGESIVHIILALFVLGGVYTFFFKTELGRSSTDIKSTELGTLHDGMNVEDEEIG
jgi:branched-subunit amino acid ABC-type transport system permease component